MSDASGTEDRLESIDAVTYEDDDGTRRRRYWDGDELVDEGVTA